MSTARWKLGSWVLLHLLAATRLAAGPLAAPVGGSGIDWLQIPAGCQGSITTDGEPLQTLACGGMGSFAFGTSSLHYHGPCTAVGASEVPAVIPVEPAPPLPAAFPCAGGRCLGHKSDRPWVAILDWPSEHGWSVAATIQEASGQQLDVELYDLTAAGGLATWVPSVSDLHVLVQLCALEERSPADRPLLVNLSFGRHRSQAAGAECGGGPSLGCAVSQVLSHLASEGVLPVAAAGNHRELLFPASTPDVISAGALDLAAYSLDRTARPSAQTPASAQALLPGYGLYLSLPPVGGVETYWPAPPGSSYAAAFFTGWLGATLAGGGKLPDRPQPAAGQWIPLATANGGFALGLGGIPLPGSDLGGAGTLLGRALGGISSPGAQPISATLRLTGFADPMPPLSVLYADAGNGPQPGVDPCVPCHGNRQEEGMAYPGALLVDLTASGGLPVQMRPRSLWLRVGGAFYGFDRSYDARLLATLAAGNLTSLALTGVGGILPAGRQPSLVFVVTVGSTDYWHEVPIQLQP
jgi:hypothetical protein